MAIAWRLEATRISLRCIQAVSKPTTTLSLRSGAIFLP